MRKTGLNKKIEKLEKIGEDIEAVGVGKKGLKKPLQRPEKNQKTNDLQEKGDQKPHKKRKRFMVIKSIYDARIAMQTILNEIRAGEWEADLVGRQLQCLDSMVNCFKIDNEAEIAKMFALAQAKGLVPGKIK